MPSLAGLVNGSTARLIGNGVGYANPSMAATRKELHIMHKMAAPSFGSLRTMNQNKVVKAVQIGNPIIMMDMNLSKLI